MPGYFYDAQRDSLSYVPDMLHNAATLKKWGHFEKLKAGKNVVTTVELVRRYRNESKAVEDEKK